MKNLLETLDAILVCCFILLLVFLFTGDPDLWDKLHAKAMAELGQTLP